MIRTQLISTVLLLTCSLSNVTTTSSIAQANSESQRRAAERETYADGLLKWNTWDSIALRRFGPAHVNWRSSVDAVPSPSGRYFYVISSRGDRGCECNVQTLELFESGQVQRWLADPLAGSPLLQPLGRLERRASTQAIFDVRWNRNSASIEFSGPDDAGYTQAYRLQIPSMTLQALTSDPSEKWLFNIQGNVVLYQREASKVEGTQVPSAPIIFAPRAQREDSASRVGDIRFLTRHISSWPEWVVSYKSGEPWVLPLKEVAGVKPYVSPDERRAILMIYNRRMEPQEFMLCDFELRQVRPLIDIAPAASVLPDEMLVTWTSDSRQVILMGTALPAGTNKLAGAARSGLLVAYDTESDRWAVLDSLDHAGLSAESIQGVAWLKTDEELLVAREAHGKPVEGTVYRRQGNRWVSRPVAASVPLPRPKVARLPDGLTVNVRQSANDPPMLFASDGRQTRALSKPDSALEGIWRAREEPFTWQMPDGERLTAGLLLPRVAQQSAPAPLVIEASHYLPEYFLPDGPVPTGFASQSLVAAGIAVLRMESYGKGTPKTRAGFVAQIDAVVEALAQRGLIDPKRVGLIGHSFTGAQAHYAVTHPGRVQLAAAEAWDAATVNYVESLISSAAPILYRSDFEQANGGSFWENKASWLEHEVTFNADRAKTPMLFGDYGQPGRALNEVQNYAVLASAGAFQLNHRPVEYLHVPRAGHVINRVRERKAVMDITVDWMKFWLQDQEDLAPEKAEQYSRWRLIRTKWKLQQQWEATGQPAGSTPDGDKLNSMGYGALYGANDPKKAIEVFGLNVALNPGISDFEDSLAEGYLQAGDRVRAIEHYEKAAALDPKTFADAAVIAARLKIGEKSLATVQREKREAYQRDSAGQSTQ